MLSAPPPSAGTSSLNQQMPQLLARTATPVPKTNTLGGFSGGGMPVGGQLQSPMNLKMLLQALLKGGH